MLTIHGRINSINVQKVVLACEELRLPYVRHDAGGAFGIVQTPEYKAMNPNSLVPVLIDGDLVLWESNAIVRYLAAKYGAGTLWPTDHGVRARSDRWMDWGSFTLYPKYHQAFWQSVRTPPEKRDQSVIDASVAATEPAMDILEAELAGKVFLAGDHPTMGDIALAPGVFRWLNMPVNRRPRPNCEAWIARVAPRPGFDKALMLPIT
ncbi:MAG: glutathione S-transferase family protein [Beijerinckiaceae bacterium]